MATKVDSDGFRVVCGRRKLKRKNEKAAVIGINIEKEYAAISEEVLLSKIGDIFRDGGFVEYFEKVQRCLKIARRQSKLQNLNKIVCLGIGSFASCPAALHQLALILQLQESLCIKEVDFYDPILSKCEVHVLKGFGWKIMSENCEGKYHLEEEVMVYLPHCPKQLINNFLWENWDGQLLRKVILICNSFNVIINNTPQRFLHQEAEYILRIAEYTKEFAFEFKYQLPEAFNDTSIHIFLEEDLSGLSSEYWTREDLPIYEDTELITKDLETKLKLTNNNA